MQQSKFAPVLVFILSVFIHACTSPDDSENGNSAGATSMPGKEDSLTNELQCSVVINGKDFTVSPDSITTAFSDRDSSFKITIPGIDAGWVVLDIPKLFKCPCKIPTGYASVYRKIYGTEEYEVVPTVELYNYPTTGISFRNLNDGQHKQDVTDNAAEIMALQKVNENVSSGWAEYIIKGRVHTTVLKNVYESAAGDANKDYTVKGKFVIQAKIWFH